MNDRLIPFHDRPDAGRRLADLLSKYGGRDDVLVLALPRGGVPVGFEVAQRLAAPLDVFVVRKLGVPWQPELAMGALASGGVLVLNPEVAGAPDIDRETIGQVVERERREIDRRERSYRGDVPRPAVEGRVVILVDDGIATGSTMRAAAQAVRELKPKRIVIATPVAPPGARERLRTDADEFVCLAEPRSFLAIGEFYRDFAQTSDDEVRALLARATTPEPGSIS